MKLFRVINFAHLFGVIWLLSIAVFAGAFFFGIKDGKVITEQYSTVLVIAVVTGLFAFLGACILYMTHYLFLRKKAVLGTPRSLTVAPVLLVGLLLLIFGAVAVRGAYNLGQADKLREMENSSKTTTETLPPIVTNTVRKVETSQPTATPVIREEQKTQQNNLVQCNVYGQTFNLTPEKCRYYQSEEAGANKTTENNDGYVPPYQDYGQSSTPVPTTAPEKYHSTQNACRQKCYETYKYYPDTSLAKQQCVNSCQ